MKTPQSLLFILIALAIHPNFSIANDDDDLFTFQVSNVEISQEAPYLINAEQMIRDTLEIKGKFEDFSYRENTEAQFADGNLPGFVLAAHTAYQSHYPLKLSVSDFIVLIGQGLSRHINNNVEELRDQFVDFEGKETIEIRRDQFVMGQQNDWSTVFGEFADEIKKRIKADIYDIVIDDTSVATPTTRIVSEITLMDSMKGYFEYMVTTLCGIPQITLQGTKEDWEKLRQKVYNLKDHNKDNSLKLDWWLDHLIPVIDKICDTAVNRKADKLFWSRFYKYETPGSGNAYVSGWITVFFPYLKSGANEFRYSTITTDELPKLFSEVPFIWNYFGNYIDMDFYGGFLGAQFNQENFTVQPAYFWSVNYKEDQTTEEEQTLFL